MGRGGDTVVWLSLRRTLLGGDHEGDSGLRVPLVALVVRQLRVDILLRHDVGHRAWGELIGSQGFQGCTHDSTSKEIK